ncbi:MAG TPA: DNA-binding protein [Stellaceae bacterium]|nr:DNA-binding protein [Stellaceae bacterium]
MHTKEYLSRREASDYLKSRGLPVAVATLNKLACVGGGPVFQSFGRLPRYRPADLDAWAAARLSKPRRSTSDRSHDLPIGGAPAEQGG